MTDEQKPVEGNPTESQAKEDLIPASRLTGLAKEKSRLEAELSAIKAAHEADAKKRAEDEAKAKGQWEQVANLAKQDAEKAMAALEATKAEYARKERVMTAKGAGLDEFTALGLEVAWREKPEADRGEFNSFLSSQIETLKASMPRVPVPMVGSPAHGNKGQNEDELLRRPLNDPEGDAARERLFKKLTGAAH